VSFDKEDCPYCDAKEDRGSIVKFGGKGTAERGTATVFGSVLVLKLRAILMALLDAPEEEKPALWNSTGMNTDGATDDA
jgi:hypothetical protein